MTERLDHEFADQLQVLGARIKKARTERGLSVRDMVVQHNYHEAQWRRYERGSSLTLPSLMRIARALGTSLSLLLDGIGEYYPAHAAKEIKAVEKSRGSSRTIRK